MLVYRRADGMRNSHRSMAEHDSTYSGWLLDVNVPWPGGFFFILSFFPGVGCMQRTCGCFFFCLKLGSGEKLKGPKAAYWYMQYNHLAWMGCCVHGCDGCGSRGGFPARDRWDNYIHDKLWLHLVVPRKRKGG